MQTADRAYFFTYWHALKKPENSNFLNNIIKKAKVSVVLPTHRLCLKLDLFILDNIAEK